MHMSVNQVNNDDDDDRQWLDVHLKLAKDHAA